MKTYKHYFYLRDKATQTTIEIARCLDEHTADYLADLYRDLYEDRDDLEVIYKYRGKKSILV